MADHKDERRFTRVEFHIAAVLTKDTAHQGVLRDISLKGAMFAADDGWQAQIGEQYQLRVELAADVAITMRGTATHVKGACVGLRCDEIDLDSITALRRLVMLNEGDEALMQRDLDALIGS